MSNERTNIYAKLLTVQNNVKCGKELYNKFGNFYYRSAETILLATKPIAAECCALITLTDELVLIGERYYVKATANFTDIESGETVSTVAFAREDAAKKGMDGSQLTGSTSSYARKYALSGLLGLNDSDDSDALPNSPVEPEKAAPIEKVLEGIPIVNVPVADTELDSAKRVLLDTAKAKGKPVQQLKMWAKQLTGKKWDEMTMDDVTKVKLELARK